MDGSKNIKHLGDVLLPLILLWVTGCAPPFSKETLATVDRNISFEELRKKAEQYTGKRVLVGGVIAHTKNTDEGTFIEVVQKSVTRRGRPRDTDVTKGRFLIISKEFLVPELFRKGRLLTVVGDVAGMKVLPLDQIDYRYPLIMSKELHLWETATGSTVHFGIGIGVSR